MRDVNEFNPGDKVEIADEGVCTVFDKLYSEANECYYYTVKRADGLPTKLTFYRAERLMPYVSKPTYNVTLTLAENLVIARLYETIGDAEPKEMATGHGHIFHDGVVGYTQAVSYATKKLYEQFDPEKVASKENNNVKRKGVTHHYGKYYPN